MLLAAINGSPRGESSNTTLLVERFFDGFRAVRDNSTSMFYVRNRKLEDETMEAVRRADAVLVAFPLYTDSMPGIVMEFFESILDNGVLNGKKILFFVHSGFPEAIHASFVVKYLERFALKCGAEYAGTITKGGSEGIKMQPEWMTRRLFESMREIGRSFAENGALAEHLLKRLAGPMRMSVPTRIAFGFFRLLGLTNFYWNYKLKENGAYDERFARPYK